jgi:hypothetical protein
MRRSACLTVALAVLASLTVASGSAIGATPDKGGAYVPTARAEDPGTSQPSDENANKSDKADKAEKKGPEPENCPQELWVIALPVEGLACVLLLPKPPPEGSGKGGGGGAAGAVGGLMQ